MLRSKFANSFILTLITFVFGAACLAVGLFVPSTTSMPVPTVAPDQTYVVVILAQKKMQRLPKKQSDLPLLRKTIYST